jgi:putative transcriptional regulator
MMVSHPAPDELLLDYAVGATGPGKSLLVATHLAMCDDSRARMEMMDAIGGAVLESMAEATLRRVTADSVLALLDDDDELLERRPSPAPRRTKESVTLGGTLGGTRVPAPLGAYADCIESKSAWRRLGFGLSAAELPVSTPDGKTQLLLARPGIRILEHTHLGEEAVLVLKGAFVDGGERYGPGDVAVNDGSTTHAPVIDDGEPCLCLAVTEAPIHFVGRYGRLFNLFNRF